MPGLEPGHPGGAFGDDPSERRPWMHGSSPQVATFIEKDMTLRDLR
jgi:hypothetical protein